MTGLLDLRPALRVVLFKTFTEKASAPFVDFRAVLHPRAGGLPPPPITGAELHIRLRLGLVRWLLSWVRLSQSALKRPYCCARHVQNAICGMPIHSELSRLQGILNQKVFCKLSSALRNITRACEGRAMLSRVGRRLPIVQHNVYHWAALLQFHLRTLPAILVYMAATSMSFVFGAGSLVLFGLWLATAKRVGKSAEAAAGPLSAELSDESEADADAASGAQYVGFAHAQ